MDKATKFKLFARYFDIIEITSNVTESRSTNGFTYEQLDALMPEDTDALQGELSELDYGDIVSEYYRAEETYTIFFNDNLDITRRQEAIRDVDDADDVKAFIDNEMLDYLNSRGIHPNTDA